MQIIGLTGRKGSGKSTVADYLMLQHGYDELTFAAPLKDGLAAMLGPLGVTRDALENPASKELHLEALDVSLRLLMQTLGTEWGRRQIDEDLWIKIAAARLIEMRRGGFVPAVVVSDIRFANEADWVRSLGGKVWDIQRVTGGTDRHASERGLAGHQVDEVILNMGTVEELFVKVDTLLDGGEI